MAQFLGQIQPYPNVVADELNQFANQQQSRKQANMKMAMDAISSGMYAPAQGQQQQPGLMQKFQNAFLGPQPGGQNMNVMGQNYQQVTPQMQAQQSADALKMQMKALSDSGMFGANAGSSARTAMINKPTIRFNGMKPEVSITQEENPEYKTYQTQQQNAKVVSDIMKAPPGDPAYETAKDLAYGKITVPFFESMMRGFSGNAMANRLAYYTKAKQINPQFNEAMFENGMYGPRQGLMALGRLQAVTGQAAKNVDAQLNIAEQLSNKINRTQYPILNKVDYLWNTDVRQIPGLSGDIKNFIYSAKLASVDAARVETGQTTGAAVTDSAREYFKNLVEATDSPDTFKKQANFTRVSTQNRMVSLSKEREDMMSQIQDMQQNLQGQPVNDEVGYKGVSDIENMGSSGSDKSSGGTYQDYLKAIGQ